MGLQRGTHKVSGMFNVSPRTLVSSVEAHWDLLMPTSNTSRMISALVGW